MESAYIFNTVSGMVPDRDALLRAAHLYEAVRPLALHRDVLEIIYQSQPVLPALKGTANTLHLVTTDAVAAHINREANSDIRIKTGLTATAIPAEAGSADLLLAFEPPALEDASTREKFIRETRRVLRNGGVAVLSVRCNVAEPGHGPHTQTEEWNRFLNRFFVHVKIYLQQSGQASFILPQLVEPGSISDMPVSGDQPPVYLIACCSDTDETPPPIGSIHFGGQAGQTPAIIAEVNPLAGALVQMPGSQVPGQTAISATPNGEGLPVPGQAAQDPVAESQPLPREWEIRLEELRTSAENVSLLLEAQKQLTTRQRFQLDAANARLQEIYDSEGFRFLSIYYRIKGRLLHEKSPQYRVMRSVFNRLRGRKPAIVTAPLPAMAAPAHSGEIRFDPIEFPVFRQPEVTIIIPVYNSWELTYRCLASIRVNAVGVSYQVILADDNSSDETRNAGSLIRNITIIRNPENLGFLGNCNGAASGVDSPFILFLNNDTQVLPGWLSALVEPMHRDPAIGLTGSKLIYPDGRLQEAGGIIWRDASGWNFGHSRDPQLPEFNYLKDADYISGASILVRTGLWNEIGGFDERYKPAYSEDSDLAFEIRKRGYRVIYQPASELLHFEGSSHGSERSRELQRINNAKFREKWKEVLDREQFPNGQHVFHARDRSAGRRTILVVDHYVPHFDKDAGSKTVFHYLRLLVKLGYNVKFIGDNFYRHEPYTSVLGQLGIEVLYGPEAANNWSQWVLDNRQYLDYVWLHRPHIAIKYIDFIRKNTSARIMYYGHDLHFMREMRQYELEGKPEQLESAEKWKKTETYLYSHSDLVLTPSEDEAVIIRGLGVGTAVQAIKPYIFDVKATGSADFGQRKDLLFIGGFGHGPNADGVKWFIAEVWPQVSRQLPGVKFLIAGSNPPQEILDMASERVQVLGFVTEEELAALYRSVRTVIIPLRYGAGVKGKTVEALFHGLPVVSTSIGTEGLPGVGEVVPATDNRDAFARRVVELYHADPEVLAAISAASAAYVNAGFYVDVVQEEMKTIMKGIS